MVLKLLRAQAFVYRCSIPRTLSVGRLSRTLLVGDKNVKTDKFSGSVVGACFKILGSLVKPKPVSVLHAEAS